MDTIVKPDNFEYGKFIQIYLDDRPHLILANHNLAHQDILEQILRESEIRFETVRLNGPNYGPDLFGGRYKLVGAGWVFVDATLELSGQSDSYRIGPNEEHSREVQTLTQIPITIK